ncbi:GDNF-inducible zinc finger protein 1-like [Schistocerca cancellata]|uniref:GDNF-inducible zinc finger protein 1-like n=1 Tax=Schistocerca cancellata TaxID=274614 RepID=UPI0021197FB0|nr:GDNF-inducible zinc finger protein 1-like [Schistocerca cancellata]
MHWTTLSVTVSSYAANNWLVTRRVVLDQVNYVKACVLESEEGLNVNRYAQENSYQQFLDISHSTVLGAPYTCDGCGRVYSHCRSLWSHIRHECGKEPQFPCPYCPLRSTKKNNLRVHVNVIIPSQHQSI